MKKTLLYFFLIMGIAHMASAQVVIFEDFDSYSPGDDIVQVNPTYFSYWPGGSTGLLVSDVQAASGNNSIYLYSDVGGGPADVVMNFQDKYDTGTANLSFKMFVSPDHGGYFNIQAERIAGTTWASNVSFFRNGTVEFSNSDNTVAASAIYPQGEWFEISYKVNLDENVWELSLNGKCLASYANPANSFSSMNLYPFSGSGNAEFWFDDIRFEHSPESEAVETDVALAPGGDRLVGFEGNTFSSVAILQNNIGEEITSAVIGVEYPGADQEITLDNLSIAPGESEEIVVPTPITIVPGITEMVVSIKSVNGMSGDDVECNNKLYAAVTAVSPYPGKAVLAEEATGTWCQFCPRGAVAMKEMEDTYGDYFVGIAVHNGDPMVVTDYDTGFSTLPGFGGYPSMSVDRRPAFTPGISIENQFLEEIVRPIKSTFDIGAELDDATNDLTISVDVNAIEGLNFIHKLVVAIVENGVTGTTSDYAQSNAFAGGDVEVGGYENLPNPVPANLMVYDDVARALLTPFVGMNLDGNINAGDNKVFNFNIGLDPSWDKDHLKLVAFIVDASNSNAVDNAFDIELNDALAGGLISVNDPVLQSSFEVYPNPVADLMNVKLESAESSDVKLELFNIYGQLMQVENLNAFVGTQNWLVNVSNLPNGSYTARVTVGNKTAVQMIQKLAR